MKKIHITFLLLLCTTLGFSQDITGIWNGIISLEQGKQIVFVFNIEALESKLITTIDIPSNRVTGLKPKATHFDKDSLYIDGSNLGIKFQGKLNRTTHQIEGTFTEGVNALPLLLKREKINIDKKVTRPQEPVKPYPYYEEDVVFENNEANITLSGTLTLPKKKGKFPVVVLISGSGPQDRDETFAGHKPFLVLADYLTRKGIAVLRYDDRGFGKSSGDFSAATTKDFSTDAISAVNYLKSRTDIDSEHIGLIGHSEGGIIAPMVANQSPDVSFIVLMASTGILGSDISLMQSKTLRPFPVPDEAVYEQAIKKVLEIASSNKETKIVKKELLDHYNLTIAPILKTVVGSDEKVNQIITQFIELRTTPWSRYFYNYNPADEFEHVKIPVLSLNGTKDTQVLAKVNQEGIRNALIKGNNKDFKILELENLNHFFQECTTGAMDEYNNIEQTIAPIALTEISTWILEHTKNHMTND